MAIWLIRLPKRTVRYLLVKLMAYVLKRPSLKLRAMVLLRKYPQAGAKLRGLTTARQHILVQAVEPPDVESLIENEDVSLIVALSRLTPGARRVYGEIKVATEQNRAEKQ